jgi:hypothetical protein
MSQSDTIEVKSSNGECDELILTVPELTSVKGNEPEANKLTEHKGLKRVPRYESTPYVRKIIDDFGTSEEDNDVNKYKTEQLKLELEELNRHLMLERISELRSTDKTRRKLQGEIANLQKDLAKKEIKIEEGKRYVQRIRQEHEVDIRDREVSTRQGI